jgi:hypothetical protein
MTQVAEYLHIKHKVLNLIPGTTTTTTKNPVKSDLKDLVASWTASRACHDENLLEAPVRSPCGGWFSLGFFRTLTDKGRLRHSEHTWLCT